MRNILFILLVAVSAPIYAQSFLDKKHKIDAEKVIKVHNQIKKYNNYNTPDDSLFYARIKKHVPNEVELPTDSLVLLLREVFHEYQEVDPHFRVHP
ncbi:hypothetical protein K5X82_08425 [Halosquirtibacter xylanolyticus]|uniref:hypothetical protein n=1 Tax=Halosquirtibacter xylanolyticus TaxID=3374599 RepID=UPI00374A5863|nr:hypothetical protein K5X82_08425 [Prolixibacteraceae bacterium]